jgi:polyisoprenoid-binding protein YceI
MVAAALVSVTTVAAGLEQSRPAAWSVTTGEIRVTCPLTVGGSFEARTTSLTGKLARDSAGTIMTGELSVDLSTIDTGISLRNQHMRDTYLEVGKGSGFDRAVLSNIDSGDLSGDFKEGSRPFSARLLLHGTTRPVSGRATLKRQGAAVHVDASFPVRLADHGIPDPRYLGVGVGKEVVVRASFVANPVP